MIAARIARRLVRKIVKPARLWLNAWQYKQSEAEVADLCAAREYAVTRERELRIQQVRLAMRRAEIAGW